MKSLIEKMIGRDFLKVLGNFDSDIILNKEEKTITCKNDCCIGKINVELGDFDVYQLQGTVTANRDIRIGCLDLCFNLGGGEFEVYTQSNGWQNESRGEWQELVSSICVEGRFSRSSSSANPFLAVWNKQTSRGVAFHLLPEFSWEMKARRVYYDGAFSNVVVEIGINKENFNFELSEGEEFGTPNVIFYEFDNKLDLDCFKLHNYLNKKLTKKPMPVTYNTWLSDFDNICFENVEKQISVASRLGVEYFVIDAGWFGKGGNWFGCRGDWEENLTGGLFGRMGEIAELVRKNNMKFGLWFEIESASPSSDIVTNHKDYFIIRGELCFLDFSNKEARDYIVSAVQKNIDKYGIEYIKFDYNQDLLLDKKGRAFIDYFKGYDEVIGRIKSNNPSVFLENCASGGQRMNIKSCADFDGFWPSDNESVYEQLRMFKDTVLRLPPRYFDRWVSIGSLTGFSPVYGGGKSDKILCCNDAIWDGIVSVEASFLEAFLSGGQIGLSCNLTKFSDKLICDLKAVISRFKQDRCFWDEAVCRILASTDEFLIFEYSDIDFNKTKIVLFSYKIRQQKIYVYPKLNRDCDYILNDGKFSGKDLEKFGIEVELDGNYRAKIIDITKAK